MGTGLGNASAVRPSEQLCGQRSPERGLHRGAPQPLSPRRHPGTMHPRQRGAPCRRTASGPTGGRRPPPSPAPPRLPARAPRPQRRPGAAEGRRGAAPRLGESQAASRASRFPRFLPSPRPAPGRREAARIPPSRRTNLRRPRPHPPRRPERGRPAGRGSGGGGSGLARAAEAAATRRAGALPSAARRSAPQHHRRSAAVTTRRARPPLRVRRAARRGGGGRKIPERAKSGASARLHFLFHSSELPLPTRAPAHQGNRGRPGASAAEGAGALRAGRERGPGRRECACAQATERASGGSLCWAPRVGQAGALCRDRRPRVPLPGCQAWLREKQQGRGPRE